MSIVPLFDERLLRHGLCLTAAWSKRSMCRWGLSWPLTVRRRWSCNGCLTLPFVMRPKVTAVHALDLAALRILPVPTEPTPQEPREPKNEYLEKTDRDGSYWIGLSW